MVIGQIKFNKHNMSIEDNMANLLSIGNVYKILPITFMTAQRKPIALCVLRISFKATSFYLKTNFSVTIFFVNKGVLENSIRHFRYSYTKV